MKIVVGTSYLQFNLGLHGGLLLRKMPTTADTPDKVIAQKLQVLHCSDEEVAAPSHPALLVWRTPVYAGTSRLA